MALRLGDLLVRHGLITQRQLQQALRNQQIFGGRLGTNLVEAGFVSETELARLLSQQLGLPAASAREFDTIPAECLAAVPKALAEKYRAIPLEIGKRELRLAMSDPTDLRVVDEIGFSTGLKIVPVVAPEILITFALEQYYGIPRKTRYLRVSGATDPELQVVHVASQMPDLVSGTEDIDLVEDRSSFLETSRKDYAQRYTIKDARRALASCKEHEDIIDTLRRYIAERFEKGVVALVRGNELIAWAQTGLDVGDQQLRQLILPLDRSTLFRRVCEAGVPFVGIGEQSEADRGLLRALGISARDDLMSAPVLVNGQAFLVMLGVNPRQGDASDQVDECDGLAKKASYAVQMIFFRRRILAE